MAITARDNFEKTVLSKGVTQSFLDNLPLNNGSAAPCLVCLRDHRQGSAQRWSVILRQYVYMFSPACTCPDVPYYTESETIAMQHEDDLMHKD